jgi:hypothetical protein
MSQHHPFDDKYWNLAQASAWVEYREKQLVNDFSVADRNAYMALRMYPSMWPTGRQQHGSVEDLRRALEQGRIKSSGYRRHTPESLEEIPAAEWTDFVIRPPLVSFAGQPNNQPWIAVRLLSADMKRLWRSVNEVDGRSKYEWAALREIYEALQTQNPEMSKNELIIELQGAYEDQWNKGAPVRATIQNRIKTWS